MEMVIDSELNIYIEDEKCHPMVFVPDVDLTTLDDDSIIEAF
jgi:hypothetical protein